MTSATSTTATAVADPAPELPAPEYRFFTTRVARVARLSPAFVRITLTGPDLADFGVAGDDQRIKLVLRRDGEPFEDLLDSPAWYETYLAMPEDRRPHVRTYTVRAARPEVAELDVDLVLHGLDGGHAGPAASWAAVAAPGDPVVVMGADRPGTGRMWGVEWSPPPTATRLLLVGDETAVPAVSSVLESLDPRGRRVVAVLEVPAAADVLDLRLPAGVEVRWLARGGRARGELLAPAVDAALRDLGIGHEQAGEEPEDVDPDLLWEVPEAAGTDECFAWLAGEAGMVKQLRRLLVRDLGVPRTSVAFMGYWRLGGTLG
ncbi:siderophore-interacting protein [Modestobacter sp. I12A-02628]|uniref:Siderophore-interacting protein n=1 Tax=Goekera deserti TaxID=2497753 RepID=A0A7K3WKP6_9ACTN|nr:siderophore-interacting protein [Goekera deserti]MPQ96654.1 siderophore-interacting protein [Goekera deserti]NDI47034.1 SIP domain-containing protein [Goekera deserti]NEL56270.1 siderophore-interacting protein [Goekera deserti]